MKLTIQKIQNSITSYIFADFSNIHFSNMLEKIDIGLICDGNRTYAEENGMPKAMGHAKGADKVIEIIEKMAEQKSNEVSSIMLYLFSTENSKRSNDEISNLQKLALKLIRNKFQKIIESQHIKIIHKGSKSGSLSTAVEEIKHLEEQTKNNTGLIVYLCIDYDGQTDIVEATNELIKKNMPVTRESMEAAMQPKLDLVIRTGKQKRLSNFALWNSAYAEFFFPEKNFPEMTFEDIVEIIKEFREKRNIKLGK